MDTELVPPPQIKRDVSLGWDQSYGFCLHLPLFKLSARVEGLLVHNVAFRDPKLIHAYLRSA